MTDENLRAMDEKQKLAIAYHEAGHLVLAVRTRGALISASIQRRGEGYQFGWNPWWGRCSSFSGFVGEDGAVIGLAGIAAEVIHDQADAEWWHVENHITDNAPEVSDADWRAIGQAFGIESFRLTDWEALDCDAVAIERRTRIIRRTVDLLKSNWAGVTAVALRLAETHTCEDWDLIQLGLFD